MANTERHIIFAPHRDDTVLTFGGRMLEILENGGHITIHLIYGIDGYLLPEFKTRLIEGDQEILSYLKNHALKTGLEDLFDSIIENAKNLKAGRYDQGDELSLGIAVRTIEERACMKFLGVESIEYEERCGYPLRGYSVFNEDNPADIKEEVSRKYKNVVFPFIETLPKDAQNVYFPSGIGGHPDHRIISLCGQLTHEMFPSVIVWFGQDMPYAVNAEWFRRSDLPLEKMTPYYIDLTNKLEEKIRLLELFYRSQLTEEDCRVTRAYHQRLAELLHRNYYTPVLTEQGINISTVKAVECLYKL